MSVTLIPWTVWWADLDPEGRKIGRQPVLVISSPFHLALTGGALVNVVPISTVARPGWAHHVPVPGGEKPGYALTEQIRTLGVGRLVGKKPAWTLDESTVSALRTELRRMLAV